MARLQSFPGLFEAVGGSITVEISRLFTPLVATGLVLVLMVLKWRFPRSPAFYTTCLVSVLTLGWACCISLGKGAGYMAIRTDSFLNIVIVTLAFLVGCLLASRPRSLIPLFVGIGFAVLLKLAYSVLMFRHFGGIELMSGVETIQGDGGTLETQAFLAAVTAAMAFDGVLRKKWKFALCMTLLCLILAGGLAASFRRMPLLTMAGVGLGSMLLVSCLQGQLRRGLAVATGACAILALVISATAVGVFGLEQATDRLASLSLSSQGAKKLGESNKEYVDEWTAFASILERSAGVGVGLRESYGIHRLIDDGSAERIPLHTGCFELWASLGVVGVVYHLTLFLFLPLVSIRRALRARPSISDGPFFSASAALLLWNGLAPLGSPFHCCPQLCLLLGLGLGCMASVSATVAGSFAATARPKRLLARRVLGPRPGQMRNAPKPAGHTFYRARRPGIERRGTSPPPWVGAQDAHMRPGAKPRLVITIVAATLMAGGMVEHNLRSLMLQRAGFEHTVQNSSRRDDTGEFLARYGGQRADRSSMILTET
jgi:hypothetical protein